jgi:hypothetical protein
MRKRGHLRHPIQIDPAMAGPLLMLSAALLFTLLNLIVQRLHRNLVTIPIEKGWEKNEKNCLGPIKPF